MTSPTQDPDATQDMGALLDSMDDFMRPLRRGQVVEGVVMRADSDGILVNIGHKAEGVVPPSEMRSLSPEDLEHINVGDPILTVVVRTDAEGDSVILSVDRAVAERGWRNLEKAHQEGARLEGKVLGFNRGGAIVEVEGIQGFVPVSQLVTVSRENCKDPEEPGRRSRITPDVGKVLQLKVLELSRGRNRAIFSERQAIQEWREEQKARLIRELREGEVRRGRVTGISSFGAFVDLGGADGLIHISELSWGQVSSPSEVVKVGDELDVYVLKVDVENKRIALSLKRLQPEPWETIHERYQVGDIVEATITKLTDFGAFARVEEAIEGLVHISELSSRLIQHPREVVREGDIVRLKILRIEPERRRLGLSLKQALEEEGEL